MSQSSNLYKWPAELRGQLFLDPATICMMEGEIIPCSNINSLNSTGHSMYQQINIHQLYALPTLFLFILYLSQNKLRVVPFRE